MLCNTEFTIIKRKVGTQLESSPITYDMYVCAIQWDPYNVDTLRNEKHAQIIRASSFQGEVYSSRMG